MMGEDIPVIEKLRLLWQRKLHVEQNASQLALVIPIILCYAEKACLENVVRPKNCQGES